VRIFEALRSPARLSFWSALAVGSTAAAGSATGLYEIAVRLHAPVPLSLPAAADVGAYVAATNIRAGRHKSLAWTLLLLLVGASAALQVTEVAHTFDPWTDPTDFWSAAAIRVVVILGALAMFELTLPERSRRSARRSTGSTPRSATQERGSAPRSTPGSAPAAPGEHPEQERSERSTPSDQDLERAPTADVEIAAWLAEQGRAPSQRSVKDAANAMGVPMSSGDALEIARRLKTPAPTPEHPGAEQ
jgi:hypothetical protein